MNKLVERFGNEKRWITYKMQKAEGKLIKVPYRAKGEYKASTTRETDWSTYKELEGSPGIIFTPDQKLLGIDIDKIFDDKLNIIHSEKENILKLIKEANTYTELSPSKKGLHLFLEITEPLALKAHRTASLPYEAYTSGRYFTVTQLPYKKEKNIRKVTKEEAEELLSIIGYPWGYQDIPQISSDMPSELDDQELLKKIFASKNGSKLESLYNYKGDDTSAIDMAFCSSLAFWTGKNFNQMERIWLASPLGQRKKTQSRQNYRNSTINKAISTCKEVYNTPKMKQEKAIKEFDLDLMHVLTKDGNKLYIQNTENVCRILRKHPDFEKVVNRKWINYI